MSENWKTNIRNATAELKKKSEDEAAKKVQLKQNSQKAVSMVNLMILPALTDLKKELSEENGTPAEVTTDKTGVGRGGYYGSITVDLGAVISKSRSDPFAGEPRSSDSKFVYRINIGASPHGVTYENEFYVTDRGQKRDLSGDIPEVLPSTDNAEVLTGEKIKQDFGLKYVNAVKYLTR